MSTIRTARSAFARPTLLGGALVLAAVGLAACSSNTSSSTTTSTTQKTTTTTSASTTTTSAATSTTTSTTEAIGGSTKNLPVTDAIRQSLVAARAAQLGIAPSTFTGLAPGSTYYAFDGPTNTYWAAAAMQVPTGNAPVGSDLYKAQVASQDDGSYLVFSQPAGSSTWSVYSVGAVGPSTPCSVTVPASVVAAWGWPAGSCRAPGH